MRIHIEATPREICSMAGLGNLPEGADVSVEIKQPVSPVAVHAPTYNVREADAAESVFDVK